MTEAAAPTTDLAAWSWNPEWGQQPADEHVRLSLHIAEPRSREWEAEQNAAIEAAMAAEADRDRAYLMDFYS